MVSANPSCGIVVYGTAPGKNAQQAGGLAVRYDVMAKHVLGSTALVGVAGLLGLLGTGAEDLIGRVSAAPPVKTEDTIEIDAAARDKMTLCTDGKSHYVAVGPSPQVSVALYYGDGKSLRWNLVPAEPHGMLPGTDFFDPRFYNKNSNPDFRGVDVRNYSSVELSTEKQTCAVHCGTRVVPLTIVPADKTRELVKKVTFVPSPQKYVP